MLENGAMDGLITTGVHWFLGGRTHQLDCCSWRSCFEEGSEWLDYVICEALQTPIFSTLAPPSMPAPITPPATDDLSLPAQQENRKIQKK
jgi:hypothetical protein